MSDCSRSSDCPQRPFDRDSLIGRALIYWFGLYQAIHVFVNLRALIRFRDDEETFPAHPPAEGWEEQVQSFFTGLATLDLVNAILTLVFVREFRRDSHRWPVLGCVGTSISLYAAILFGYGTRRAGAWRDHPLPYRVIYLAYVPCVVLFGYFARWMLPWMTAGQSRLETISGD